MRGAEGTAVLMEHIGGGTRGRRGPLGMGLRPRSTGGRVPGRAVREEGVSLEGRPESARLPPTSHCNTELPRTAGCCHPGHRGGDAAPGVPVSPALDRRTVGVARAPALGTQDPEGQDTRAGRWRLPFPPEAASQRPRKPHHDPTPWKTVSATRGESRPLWTVGQCLSRCRPSHPGRGQRGTPPPWQRRPRPAASPCWGHQRAPCRFPSAAEPWGASGFLCDVAAGLQLLAQPPQGQAPRARAAVLD